MKILYLVHQFYPEYYTGTEKIVFNLATMMQKCGNRVKVITYSFYENSSYNGKTGNILHREFIYKGIPVLALKHEKLPEDLNHAIENKELSEVACSLISKEKPDVAHVGHCMMVGELVKGLRHLKIPYIVTLTDYFLLCPKVNLITSKDSLCFGPQEGRECSRLCPELSGEYIASRLQSAKEILLNAQIIVAPSKFLAGMFKSEFETLDVKVINHGFKYGELKRNGKRYTKHDNVVFCYSGSLNSHKGTHILIEAFKKIRSEKSILKIYGSGPDEFYVRNVMAMARGDRRIEFCGVYPGDRTGEILNSVDVVVIPSLCHESYSLILHEALACEVPVIAADVGGLGEKIEDKVNGLLFRMGDLHHLEEIMQTVVDNPIMLNSLKDHMKAMVVPAVEEEAYAYERAYRLIRDRRVLCHGRAKHLRNWAAFCMTHFDGIGLAQGYIEKIAYDEGALLVQGWMFLPEKPFSSIRVYLNKELVGYPKAEYRPDVAKVFPGILHAGNSGFQFYSKKVPLEALGLGRVDLIGFQDGRPVARMNSLYRKDLHAAVPTPPPELMQRVTGTREAQLFKIGGLKSFGEFLEPILRHREIYSIRRLLDWGCGCGRVSVHFLLAPDGPEVFGCDIDAEAVAWCVEYLQPGKFSHIQPWPPTPYEDASFDLVLGFSVFTHLTKDLQKAWLAEMRRITVPGGLFLASSHGKSAASAAFPDTSVEMLKNGIFDGVQDATLDGIAPQGYYRGVYQTREYTLQEWSKYFEILEYIERGISNHQDLVVMRKRV